MEKGLRCQNAFGDIAYSIAYQRIAYGIQRASTSDEMKANGIEDEGPFCSTVALSPPSPMFTPSLSAANSLRASTLPQHERRILTSCSSPSTTCPDHIFTTSLERIVALPLHYDTYTPPSSQSLAKMREIVRGTPMRPLKPQRVPLVLCRSDQLADLHPSWHIGSPPNRTMR